MGSCGKEIGYLSNGTSMDWAYDEMKVSIIFFDKRSHTHSHLKYFTLL